MLGCSASMNVIHDIPYAERVATEPPIWFNDLPVHSFFRIQMSKAVKETLALTAITRLAKSLRFNVVDLPYERIHGITSPGLEQYPQGIKILDVSKADQIGLASTINLKDDYLRGLMMLYRDPKKNMMQIAKLIFNPAVTLCHEIIHALNFASNTELFNEYTKRGLWGQRRMYHNEPFRGDNRQAELGFLWESIVFGGTIGQSLEDHNAPVIVAEWPSLSLHDPEIYPWRKGFPANTVEYLILMQYLINIQFERYWKGTADSPQNFRSGWLSGPGMSMWGTL